MAKRITREQTLLDLSRLAQLNSVAKLNPEINMLSIKIAKAIKAILDVANKELKGAEKKIVMRDASHSVGEMIGWRILQQLDIEVDNEDAKSPADVKM